DRCVLRRGAVRVAQFRAACVRLAALSFRTALVKREARPLRQYRVVPVELPALARTGAARRRARGPAAVPGWPLRREAARPRVSLATAADGPSQPEPVEGSAPAAAPGAAVAPRAAGHRPRLHHQAGRVRIAGGTPGR